MSRLAIGYSPNPDELDRPTTVFIEADQGVWIQRRGDFGPRVLDEPLTVRIDDSDAEQVGPGQPRYFDLVLDSFSSSCLIRTVTEFEPGMFSSLLTSTDEIWEALPRPQMAAEPASA